MGIRIRRENGVVIVEPEDRLTIETERDFSTAVRGLLDAGALHLILDLAGAPSLDSIGLGAIVQAYTSARRRGGDLKLLHVGRRNRELLRVTKLLTVIETYDDEREALRSFGADGRSRFALIA
jgi:anti-sigma B factor antagonist